MIPQLQSNPSRASLQDRQKHLSVPNLSSQYPPNTMKKQITQGKTLRAASREIINNNSYSNQSLGVYKNQYQDKLEKLLSFRNSRTNFKGLNLEKQCDIQSKNVNKPYCPKFLIPTSQNDQSIDFNTPEPAQEINSSKILPISSEQSNLYFPNTYPSYSSYQSEPLQIKHNASEKSNEKVKEIIDQEWHQWQPQQKKFQKLKVQNKEISLDVVKLREKLVLMAEEKKKVSGKKEPVKGCKINLQKLKLMTDHSSSIGDSYNTLKFRDKGNTCRSSQNSSLPISQQIFSKEQTLQIIYPEWDEINTEEGENTKKQNKLQIIHVTSTEDTNASPVQNSSQEPIIELQEEQKYEEIYNLNDQNLSLTKSQTEDKFEKIELLRIKQETNTSSPYVINLIKPQFNSLQLDEWSSKLNQKWIFRKDFDPQGYETLFLGSSLTPNYTRVLLQLSQLAIQTIPSIKSCAQALQTMLKQIFKGQWVVFMVAANKKSKRKMQCAAHYTEFTGIDVKLLWGQTVYMNLWQPGELEIPEGSQILEFGSTISKSMILKILEVCNESIQIKSLDLTIINVEIANKLNVMFGPDWTVNASKKECQFNKNEINNEKRIKLQLNYKKQWTYFNIVKTEVNNIEILPFNYPMNKLQQNESIEYITEKSSSLTKTQLEIICDIILQNTRLNQINLSQLTQLIKDQLDSVLCPFWTVFVASKDTMKGTCYESYDNKQFSLLINNLLYFEIFQQ